MELATSNLSEDFFSNIERVLASDIVTILKPSYDATVEVEQVSHIIHPNANSVWHDATSLTGCARVCADRTSLGLRGGVIHRVWI